MEKYFQKITNITIADPKYRSVRLLYLPVDCLLLGTLTHLTKQSYNFFIFANSTLKL